MASIKHENVNLLLFLNAILGSVLEGLTGYFEKSAKYKFNKVVNCINELEKDVLRNCTELVHDTYADSVESIAEILNITMEAYDKEKIGKLLEHIKTFKP